MKSTIISTLIVLILLISWFFLYSYISDLSIELISLIRKIENNIEKEQWFPANESLKEFESKWIKSLNILKLTIDHDEIEKVNLSLSKVKKHISTKNKVFLANEITALIFHVDHIKEKESFSLKNIF